MRSKRFYHLFWTRFEFFFVVIFFRFFYGLFLTSFAYLSHLSHVYDAISRSKNVDFEIFLNNIFKSHFWIEHHLKKSLFYNVVQIIIVNIFNYVKSFNLIILLIINIILQIDYVICLTQKQTTSSLTTNRISRNTSIIYLNTVRVKDEYRSCRRRLSVETTSRDRSSLHHESIYKIASNKCRKT